MATVTRISNVVFLCQREEKEGAERTGDTRSRHYTGPGWPQVPYTMVGPGKVISRGLGTWINDPGRRTVSISFQGLCRELAGGCKRLGECMCSGSSGESDRNEAPRWDPACPPQCLPL
ncbi:Hypothetical predicted protein [Marmota monax]|uniref:Uncharacterized protein n=1 Tax=Marmota monax TaxID=9995 RepID=A0A5E4CXN2_MARMO|nr:Hypothetical predicted protein [Marmota monax]